MKMIRFLSVGLTFCFVFCLTGFSSVSAQQTLARRLFMQDTRIDPALKGQLFFEVENLDFFKNNEYEGKFQKGYSLPGFRLRANAVYYPLEMIKVELGFYGLRYWGANTYPFPSLAYQGIPEWEAKHYQKGFHALPWLRAQVRLSDQFQLVMGNIYGAANHKLMAPLYNPELNLTADPEVGVQLLFESAPFDLDLWLNWESFIFYGDTHQEVFTIGLSTNLKLNNPESRFHFYMPLQGLIQHRGGEIDTITVNSVNTLMNGGIGFGAIWNTGYQGLKSLNLEVDALGYYQQAGKLWPFESGMGIFAQAAADVRNFRFKGGYWWCHNYISMFGNPFFGSISTSEPGVTFHNPSMIYLGAEYSYEFAKGFAVGGEVDVFESLPVRMHGGEFEGFKASSKTSFSAGIYLRVTPSFLLWKGKK